MKSSIANGEGSLDVVRQPNCNDEEVVDFAVACVRLKGVESPTYFLDPTRVAEFLRLHGAVMPPCPTVL